MQPKENPRLTLIERTEANLIHIELSPKDRVRGPFEVTQLINSFLIAFIHSREYWLDQIPTTPLPIYGWPAIHTEAKYQANAPDNLRKLVRVIRNALAHGNLEILPDTYQGEIEDRNIGFVRLWNTPPESEVVIWETTITVADLRQLLTLFLPIAKQLARDNAPPV